MIQTRNNQLINRCVLQPLCIVLQPLHNIFKFDKYKFFTNDSYESGMDYLLSKLPWKKNKTR